MRNPEDQFRKYERFALGLIALGVVMMVAGFVGLGFIVVALLSHFGVL